ncbi:MAG: sodium:calcium antiporter [Phycisphaerae bacterium]
MKRHHLMLFAIASAAAAPGIAVRLLGVHLNPPAMALVSGTAILGASFLLLWACDAAQADISQTLALAVVALIAVLPEYAVDMYFTWEAGRHPASDYAHYAVANMTGANRLLIGVAWGLIAAIYWIRRRRAVRLEPDRRTELLFLGLATVYAFIIPIKGTLAWYDGCVFLGIYVWYIILAGRRPCVESEAEGPAELLIRLPRAGRRIATALLFLFAAGAILANAEPFCEGLVGTGKVLRINEFVLVQWLAPIASEAPEFIVALVFAWRGQAGMALGSLLSAKLNQWTLLVGMIPGVFAVSHWSLEHPIPMGGFQMHEILLTAAQSLLAVVMLSSLELSLSGAFLLFILFAGQLVAPSLMAAFPAMTPFGLTTEQIHPIFSILYLVAAAAIFLQQPRTLLTLRQGARIDAPSADPGVGKDVSPDAEASPHILKTEHCGRCRWRLRAVADEETRAVPK